MAALRTSLVTRRHAWTGDDIPWIMETDTTVGSAPRGGWRLFHYLSGGGLKGFGASNARRLAERRQNRFLVLAAILGVCWLALRFI